jgi:Sulfatase
MMASDVAGEASGVGAEAGGLRRGFGRLPAVLWWSLLELFVVTGLVVAQPLLDVAGKAPDFFVLHRVGRFEILLLVAMVVVVPGLVLWLGELVVWLVGRWRLVGLAHVAVLAGLFAVLALEVGKKTTGLRGKRLVLAALVVGVLVGVVYRRWSGVRLWLRYLAPAPVVFALLFVTVSPTAPLVLPGRAAQGAGTVPVRTHPGGTLPPVVMVFFDEFPLQSLLDSSGRIDRRVYPRFADFAADATWYRNATGVSSWTPYAVPAMLTGRYPGKGRAGVAPVSQSYPDNLFTMFGHHYNLKVFETVTQLCPPARCGQTGSRSGFGVVVKDLAKVYKDIASPIEVPVNPDTVGQDISPAASQADGPTALFTNLGQNQPARVDRFLSSINASDPQPTLYFLHVLLPHGPWKYLPDGRVYNAASVGKLVSGRSVWPNPLQHTSRERHLLQLAYTDAIVGKLIDRLKQQGLYDKALVVMTADHGEGFTPGDTMRALGPKNAPGVMWVPMFVKPPHQGQGRIDDRNWEQVDLLPTVADIAGLSVPWTVDGFPQNGPPRRQRTDKLWYNQPGRRRAIPGPSNFQKVLHGVTDTLVRAHQDGAKGFFQFGETADWVYKTPQTIGQIGARGSQTARIKNWATFKSVVPGSTPAPAIIVGAITSGAPPPGSRVVVAINGRIGGVSNLYPPDDGQQPVAFAALVPDFLFKPGPGQRQIQIYLATGAGSQATLHPLGISG